VKSYASGSCSPSAKRRVHSAATLAEGEDPTITKCVLDGLLGGKPSASAADLHARKPVVAETCSLPDALVSEYVQRLGAAEFAPTITAITYLSFFTRAGTIGVLVMAPLERQQAVDEAAALIWRETQVTEEARLPVAFGGDLFQIAQLVGIVLGAILGVLVLGGALSWLLTRFGLRAALAVGSTLGLLCALAMVGWLRGGLRLEGGLQVGGYLLASALGFRPLVRWLSSRGGSPLDRARALRRSRGLSTVEYVVILVLLACVAIGAWGIFGRSVRQALSSSDGQLDSLTSTALDDFGPSVADSREPSASAGQTAPDSRDRATPSGDTASNAAPARRAEGGDPRPSAQTGAGRAAGGDSWSARSGAESSGSAAQGAATGALQGALPGGVVTPAAPPAAPVPPNAGPVVASAAQGPSVLLTGTDIATDFVPVVSNVKDATTALTGINPVTGEEVGTLGRLAAGVFAIPGAGNLVKYVGKGGKAAYESVQASRAASKPPRLPRLPPSSSGRSRRPLRGARRGKSPKQQRGEPQSRRSGRRQRRPRVQPRTSTQAFPNRVAPRIA